MAKRRELEVALLAALVAVAPGCAGKPVWPWSSKTAHAPTSLDELTARNSAKSSSWTDKLSIKPKVIPAEDQLSLATQPKSIGAEVYLQAARMHEKHGSIDDAKEQYRRAIEAEPKNVVSLIGLARLHDRQQEFADAERLYRQAAGMEPNNALVWNDLGLCYARQKRHQEAIQTLDQAIRLQPTNKMYRNNLATVLVETGRTDLAWAQLTAVNDPAVAHYNMGFLLHKQQLDDLAVQHLYQALEANPSLAAAEQLLGQLQGRAGTTEELVIEQPAYGSSYTITDQRHAQPTYEPPPSGGSEWSMAQRDDGDLVNPLAPSNRRSATYRMPPVAEQEDDPAPAPTRLPEVPVFVPAQEAEPALNFPSRRIAHVEEETPLSQPRNVIRLLGSEPLTAPIPSDE